MVISACYLYWMLLSNSEGGEREGSLETEGPVSLVYNQKSLGVKDWDPRLPFDFHMCVSAHIHTKIEEKSLELVPSC